MSGNNHMISVHPEELKFKFELEKQCFSDLKVVNNSEHHVAFKVKTTSPKKYFVRPNSGVVQPWDSCVITVTLQAQREYPPDMQCKDKFLLQSTIVAPNTNADDIPQDAFSKDGEKVIEECKLRVVYTTSASGSSEEEALFTRNSKLSPDARLSSGNSSFDDAHAVQRLKEERNTAVQQTQQLQQELEMLRRRRVQRRDPGFSLMFAAFVGLIGIMVGFILKLALSGPSAE